MSQALSVKEKKISDTIRVCKEDFIKKKKRERETITIGIMTY